MKTYEFPYGGDRGPHGHDGWDSVIEFELTDEEAERLIASARASEMCWHLDDDDAISDIRERIERRIIEETLEAIPDRIEELREEWLEDNPDADEDEIPTDEELLEEEMGNWYVCYPDELQEMREEEEWRKEWGEEGDEEDEDE